MAMFMQFQFAAVTCFCNREACDCAELDGASFSGDGSHADGDIIVTNVVVVDNSEEVDVVE